VGKTITPKYRIEAKAVFITEDGRLQHTELVVPFNGKNLGRANDAAAKKFRAAMMDAHANPPDRTNPTDWPVNMGTVRIIEQATGALAGIYVPPKFVVV